MTRKEYDKIGPGNILENIDLPAGHELKFGVVIMKWHIPADGWGIDATDFDGHIWAWKMEENLKVSGYINLMPLHRLQQSQEIQSE